MSVVLSLLSPRINGALDELPDSVRLRVLLCRVCESFFDGSGADGVAPNLSVHIVYTHIVYTLQTTTGARVAGGRQAGGRQVRMRSPSFAL